MDFKGTVMLDLFSMDNETVVVDKNKVEASISFSILNFR